MARQHLQSLAFSFIFLCIAFGIQARQIQSVSGRVVDSAGNPQYGNAIILSPGDSSIITGVAFWEGDFLVENLNQQQVLLKLSSLEFKDHYQLLHYNGNTSINLGEIEVTGWSNELDEVVVTGQRPIITEKADGSITIQVQNTALATSSSVNEILERAPGIVQDEENGLSVFGKGAALLYLNGKRIDPARLSTLSPSSITSVEIISNPGPRYDAEGNAVINITTDRALSDGGRGSLRNYYTFNKFAGHQNRLNLDYQLAKGKWSLNSSYGLQTGNTRQLLKTSRTRGSETTPFRSYVETDWQYDFDNYSSYSLGIQYDLNPRSYFSLDYSGAFEKLGGNQFSENDISFIENGRFESTLDMDELTVKNTFNANYFIETNERGSHFFLGSQYSNFQTDFDNRISEWSEVNGRQSSGLIDNTGNSEFNIVSNQLDYTEVLNTALTLETGLKYWHVDVNSHTDFFDIEEGQNPIRDEEISNNFEYTEKVKAAYVNLKGQFTDSVRYSLGLRTEHMKYKLLSTALEGRSLNKNVINFFPNASLNASLRSGVNLFLTYSSRINRPSYERLNPFIVYQDEFTSIQGNSDLVSTKTHALELGGFYQGWNVKTGYNFIKDPIYGGAFQSGEDDRVYILQRFNMSRETSFFVSVTKGFQLGWWNSTNTASITRARLNDETGQFMIRQTRPNVYLYTQNSFEIKNFLKLYLTAWFIGDKQDGIYLRKNQSTINLGLEKGLFRDKLKTNLDFNDIFHNVRPAGAYSTGSTDIEYGRTHSTNFIRFSISYSFGGPGKPGFKNKKVGESETNRAL